MLNSALLSLRFAISLFHKPALMAWTMHVEVHMNTPISSSEHLGKRPYGL